MSIHYYSRRVRELLLSAGQVLAPGVEKGANLRPALLGPTGETTVLWWKIPDTPGRGFKSCQVTS